MFKFKLYKYDEDYYKIYEKLLRSDLNRVPSFRLMNKLLDVRQNEFLLDVGCGCGHHLNYCRKDSMRAVGIDISSAALKIARAHFPLLNFLQQDAQHLGFKDEEFDKILCYNFIEHINNQEQALLQIRRVLKTGGTLVIGTVIRDSLTWKLYQMTITDHTHSREFSMGEFIEFVGRYFDIVQVVKSSGVFRFAPPLSWLFHYLLKSDVLIKAIKSKK